ncbi:hypothetical protein FOS14_08865 [Skermania sp. ID1734]|uniref:hypothetical protein n=1 Tax=Skermania sp. ID1734 TaxID=2597516 RepID=UPI00117E3F43|nr:hypothetical protein [Skermania sp. ID1734]TSD99937.1 hypothetical protein FOS14_08865 [Skermania sp. ID1734]
MGLWVVPLVFAEGADARTIGSVIGLGDHSGYFVIAYVVSRIVYLLVVIGLLVALYRFLHR